jgi:soluble lytic murein transglycosylase-like protein
MGPIGAMPGAGASSGLAEAQARVAAIRDRIDGLTAPSAGFALPSAPPRVPGDTGGTATMPAVPDRAPVTTAAAPASARAEAPVSTPTAARPGEVGTAAELAAKLPANGARWATSIDRAARAAGVEPALLAALVRHESNFNPNARSHAGAIGLTQLMPGTAAGLNVDPHDPEQNLAGGARFLRSMLDRFGSVELGLAAYNAGPNRVAQAGGIPRITETQNFVQRVTATWEQYR